MRINLSKQRLIDCGFTVHTFATGNDSVTIDATIFANPARLFDGHLDPRTADALARMEVKATHDALTAVAVETDMQVTSARKTRREPFNPNA